MWQATGMGNARAAEEGGDQGGAKGAKGCVGCVCDGGAEVGSDAAHTRTRHTAHGQMFGGLAFGSYESGASVWLVCGLAGAGSTRK